LAEKSGEYLAEHLEGMRPEEAAVTAFLRFRLGEMAAESRAAAKTPPHEAPVRDIAGKARKEPVPAASD
jgi:hypothetical protein